MTIWLNGCWDVLHVGHINMLLHARALAGEGKVVVGVDEDDKVSADKGLDRPIFDVHERAKALLDLSWMGRPVVDQVEFFSTNAQLENIIRDLRPDYLMKGSDWRGRVVVGSQYAKVIFYDRMELYSTTEIIRRILEKNKTI